MRCVWRHGVAGAMAMAMTVVAQAQAQHRLTWPEIVARFEAANPAVLAGRIGLDESRAAEITAFLRPNPQLSVSVDQLPIVGEATYPLENLLTVATASYLHERRHKRELRRDSAQ